MNRKITLLAFTIIIIAFISCKQKTPPPPVLNTDLQGSINRFNRAAFDSLAIDSFFIQYAELTKYKENIKVIYRGYKFHFIWFDEKGVLEFANSLYGKVKGIASEGVYALFPYQKKIEPVFELDGENSLSNEETELMITSMFLFYAEKVYKGVDDKTAAAIDWLLPKKQVSYENLLDSLMQNTNLLSKNETVAQNQYSRLRVKLEKYRNIQRNGGWDSIFVEPKFKSFKPGDSAVAILQIRNRLFITGDITENDKSNLYDDALLVAVNKYQKRNGKKEQASITP